MFGPCLLEHARGIVQQDPLEEHQGEVVGELLDDGDVRVVEGVAGLAPLDLLVQAGGEQQRTQRRDLVGPLVAGLEVGVDVGEVLHGGSGRVVSAGEVGLELVEVLLVAPLHADGSHLRATADVGDGDREVQ